MRNLTDENIMNRVQEGQVEMLAVLFERYHVKIFNYMLRLTGGERTIGEDLTQDVFFRMLKYRHTYNPERKLTSWMYQIARNVFLDHVKKNAADTMVLEDDQPEFPRETAEPLAVVEKKDQERLLRDALSKLPARKRELLVLSRFHHMKYKEIAEVLDCSIEAVKVGIHRAVKELRRGLTA